MLLFEHQQLEDTDQICTPRPPALHYPNTVHVQSALLQSDVLLTLHEAGAQNKTQ